MRGGLNALPLLRKLLREPDDHLRQEVFEVIGRLGPCSTPLLIEALTAEESSIRLQAVSILIDFAPDTTSAQPALVRALRDENPLVARDAARALGALGALAAIGPPAASAVPRLIDRLRDEFLIVRICAAGALGHIGTRAVATKDTRKCHHHVHRVLSR